MSASEKFEFSLLSGHYLTNHKSLDELYRRIGLNASESERLWSQLIALYEKNKNFLPKASEAETESKFIEKVLECILGFETYRQPRTRAGTRPDYALFSSREQYESGIRGAQRGVDYRASCAIAEAKYWERPLNTKNSDGKRDDVTSKSCNPVLQITEYLYRSGVTWGILTNGCIWSLYHREESATDLQNHVRCDLKAILEENDYGSFRWFLALFSAACFAKNTDGTCLLDEALRESRDYQQTLGESLQENIFNTIPIFVKAVAGESDLRRLQQPELNAIYERALVFHYRLLFILFAESKRKGATLLPVENRHYYENYSLSKIRDDLRLRGVFNLKESGTEIQDRLQRLFELIDVGSISLGIPKKDFYIPAYNGGLFKDHRIVTGRKLGNRALASIIGTLCFRNFGDVTQRGIDFSTLSVGHLGSIYEGLLQYELRVAQTDLTVTKKKDIEVYKEVEGKKRGTVVVSAGTPYLTTHKNERRATGSYFTPSEHVRKMVSVTLRPVVDACREKDGTLDIKKLLQLRVLDPAMGSGHFLVEALDYLAKALLEAMKEDSASGIEVDDELVWARREVVEHCLYGVDMNPLAVELAKVSLWLASLSRNEALSFLEHHLRCGDALLDFTQQGEWQELSDLGNKCIKLHEKLLSFSSSSDERVHKKEEILAEIEKLRSPFRRRLVSQALAAFDAEQEAQSNRAKKKKEKLTGLPDSLVEKLRPFVWRLEFPEVFSPDKREAGFDAILGNPPYEVLERDSSLSDDEIAELEAYRELIRRIPIYEKYLKGKINLYKVFLGRAFELLAPHGRMGFVVPLDILSSESTAPIREHIREKMTLTAIYAFPQKDDPNNRVFKDAKISTCVLILGNGVQPAADWFELYIYPGKTFKETPSRAKFTWPLISQLHSELLPIPLVSEREWKLLRRLCVSTDLQKIGHICHAHRGEINQKTNAACLSDTPTSAKLWRGAHVRRFGVVPVSKQGDDAWVDTDVLRNEFPVLIGKSASARLITQQNSGQDDTERLTAAILPKGEILAETANYLDGKLTDRQLVTLAGILNSHLMDWRFRVLSTTNHVTTEELENLPTPDLSETEKKTSGFARYCKVLFSSSPSSLAGLWNCSPECAVSLLVLSGRYLSLLTDRYFARIDRVAKAVARIANIEYVDAWKSLDSYLNKVVAEPKSEYKLPSGLPAMAGRRVMQEVEKLRRFAVENRTRFKEMDQRHQVLVFRAYGLSSTDARVIERRLEQEAISEAVEEKASSQS